MSRAFQTSPSLLKQGRIMTKNLDRRDFEKRASLAVSGLLTGALLGSGHSAGQDPDMSDKRLVLLGLNALARAHELDYFADGHRGAAMVAAHLLCVDNDLDQRATSRIVELVDLNWAKSALCKPFPGAEPEPARVDKIGVAHAAVRIPIRSAIPITSQATCGRLNRRIGRGAGIRAWVSGTCSSTHTPTTTFCDAPAIPN